MKTIQELQNSAEQLNRKINASEALWAAEREDVRELDVAISESNPLVISFVGRFKSGKSSLVNALLGMNLLPTRATTATAVITRITYGDELKAFLNRGLGPQEITVDEACETILNHDSRSNFMAEVIFQVPSPLLKGNVELRDTPGMLDSAQGGALQEVALRALHGADLCVFVCDAASFISQGERMLIEDVHRSHGGNLVYAVNCINRLNTQEDRDEVERLARRTFAERTHPAGMGEYWMMCSAPGMIDLGGFDVWLANLLNPKRAALLNALRANSAHAQLRAKDAEIAEQAQEMKAEVEAQLRETEMAQEVLLQKLRAEAKEKFDAEAEKLREKRAMVQGRLANTEGLQEKLEALADKKNWWDTYAEDSKAIVTEFLDARCKEQFENLPMLKKEPELVQKTVGELDFPGPEFTQKKAFSKVSTVMNGENAKAYAKKRKSNSLKARLILAGILDIDFIGGGLTSGDTSIAAVFIVLACALTLFICIMMSKSFRKSLKKMNTSPMNTLSFVGRKVTPALNQAINDCVEGPIRARTDRYQVAASGLEGALDALRARCGKLAELMERGGIAANEGEED